MKYIFALLLTLNITYANLDPGMVTDMLQADNASLVSSTVNTTPETNNVVNMAASSANTPITSNNLDPKILGLTKNYAIVVFYESTCPHCQRFTPILKEFTDAYGFKVYAFTLNNQSLPAFPNSFPANQSILDSFFMGQQIEVPASFLVNQQTMMTYPINVGEMQSTELTQRLDQIADSIQQGRA